MTTDIHAATESLRRCLRDGVLPTSGVLAMFDAVAVDALLAALEARDAEIAALREEVMELPLCATEKYTLRVGQVYRFVPVVGCASCAHLAAQALASYGDESQPKPPPIYPSTEGQRIARQIREGKEGKEERKDR